jgi:NodT family efflux transporter outer membrane factor (OMF) lipoprotein
MPWLTLSLAMALFGCSSLSPRTPQTLVDDVPAGWSVAGTASAGTSASSLAAWWQHFDDPLLGRLIEQALAANTDVLVAQATLRQARALRDVAAAGLLPSVGSSASAQHSSAGTGSSRVTGDSFNAGFDASWELDVFGVNRSGLRSSEATLQATAATLGDVRTSVAAEVALDYIAVRGGQARLLIAQRNLASQQETLQITQWRLQAGLVTSLESEQARASVEQTGALVPALQTLIEQSAHALAVLTGQPPAALAAVLSGPGAVPRAADDLALSLPAETLRQRPDVRAAEHRVMAAAANVDQAEAARLPKFNLSGSLGLSALSLGALTNGASLVGSLMAGVTLPIFDGGALLAQVRAQQAALEQSEYAWRATVLTALKDVEDALVALRGDRERLLRLEQAADAAANASLMANQRFSSGLIDFQTVLDSQRTQLGTQDSVASAGADVASDHVRLYKALGGGWVPDTTAGAPATDTAATGPNASRVTPP